ncbi:ABC transporter permease [Streptomyces sp. NPDC046197]|uniref:ABC transporter permease n=1 Tax=Streptomyces sp. NPDC046197 TaxID=3154337 RepID=UPI0033C31846
MTTTLESPAPAATEAAYEGRRRPAVVALARFEARELLLKVPVFAVLVLYLAETGWAMFSGHEGMDDFPALQDVDRATQSGSLLVGVALFACANRAVLRSRRRGTDRHFDVLVMEPWRRTLGHALSVVPFALLVALVVAFRFGRAAVEPGAVGHGSVAELAVGPLTVLLGGVAGVLLGRLIPSSFAAPLFAVALYVAVTYVGVFADNALWSRWLAPVVEDRGADPFPSDLVGRPAAWHALYLTGLVATLLGAALLRSGGRTVRVKAVTALALAATAAGIAGQAQGPSAALEAARAKVSVSPEQAESCTVRGTTTYCALPEWTGRTAEWAKTVTRVQSLAGGSAAGQRLTVRQRVDARDGLQNDPYYEPLTRRGETTVLTRWGGNRIPEFSVGLASVLVAGDEKAGAAVCDGRVVTVMWLALGNDPAPMTALRNVRLDDSVKGSAYVLTPTNGLKMSAEQTRIVRELLHRPRPQVTAAVKAHWAELTAPGVPTVRVGRLLGVPSAAPGTESEDACGE